MKTWFQNRRSKLKKAKARLAAQGIPAWHSGIQEVVDNQAPEYEEQLIKSQNIDTPSSQSFRNGSSHQEGMDLLNKPMTDS